MRSSVRALLLATLLLVAITAPSYGNHNWGRYHWGRSTSLFTLETGDNVGSAWDTYLNEAITDWNQPINQPMVLKLEKVSGGTTGAACQPTLGRIEACNAAYGTNGWLGIAQIWTTNRGHITQAVTKVNDSYFNTATYNTPAWRRLVMCQEIAHDFGLDHQDERFSNRNLGSCMDYTNDPDGPPSNEHPNAHDFEQLAEIYSHVDSSTTVGALPPTAAPVDLNAPSSWGQLVRSNAAGRVQTFERGLGRGAKLVTHVFWADPEHDANHH
jgi:hypothetical protein